MKLSLRYRLPLLSIWDWWPLKMILSTLLLLLHVEVEFVVVVSFLVVIDYVTGIWASKRRGIPILSLGLRQTFAKSIEYLVILTVATTLSNTFEMLSWIRAWCFLIVCLTEAKSVLENLSRPGSIADKLWALMREQMRRRSGDDLTAFLDEGKEKKSES